MEEEVDEELVTVHLDTVLAADEGEARAQLQQEPSDVADDGILDVALVGLLAQAQEIEMVRVLEHLCDQPCLGRRQPAIEVVQRRPLPQVEPALDMRFEDGTGPALRERPRRVPLSGDGVGNLGQESDDVEPGQLVSRLLTDSKLRAALRPIEGRTLAADVH